mgnify:CR=1 FL=1
MTKAKKLAGGMDSEQSTASLNTIYGQEACKNDEDVT